MLLSSMFCSFLADHHQLFTVQKELGLFMYYCSLYKESLTVA